MDASFAAKNASGPRRTRWRVIIGFLLIGLGLFLLLERHFGKMAYFVVTSESMEPTIKINDRVFMERADKYQAGDIIVFDQPGNPNTKLVKRIVAVSGDEVFAWGDVDLVISHHPSLPLNTPIRKWKIGESEVFVAGDNRAGSKDSRDFGPIPIDSIRGAVRYRYVSLLHWEHVK
jgi:signal peptidase I